MRHQRRLLLPEVEGRDVVTPLAHQVEKQKQAAGRALIDNMNATNQIHHARCFLSLC